jgi:hypothetical protein
MFKNGTKQICRSVLSVFYELYTVDYRSNFRTPDRQSIMFTTSSMAMYSYRYPYVYIVRGVSLPGTIRPKVIMIEGMRVDPSLSDCFHQRKKLFTPANNASSSQSKERSSSSIVVVFTGRTSLCSLSTVCTTDFTVTLRRQSVQ